MSTISAAIASQILEDDSRWDLAEEFHIDSFLKSYSLHDSYWISLQTNCAWENSAVAIIQLDSVWNPFVSAPTSHVADWPLLLLRFSCVSAIHLSGFRDNVRCQRGIGNVLVDHISEEEVTTKFLDHYGASVEVRHFPLIKALAMSPSGDTLKLSNQVA